MQAFECVSILFCELVGLTSATVKETMMVVETMNSVFSCFDALMDKFKVYKVWIFLQENQKKYCLNLFFHQVETVGQVYMVASGAPERTDLHAQNIADLAFAMLRDVKEIRTPENQKVEIRIGNNKN